jgi:hypothetical protein
MRSNDNHRASYSVASAPQTWIVGFVAGWIAITNPMYFLFLNSSKVNKEMQCYNPIDRWTIQVNDQNLSLRLYLSYSSHNSFHVSLCTSRICFLGEVPSAFPMFQWKPFIPLQQGFNENSSEMGKDILVYISLNKARLPLQETQISEHS